MPGTTIHLDGWYSDAPKAIGEEPNLIPDELSEDGEDEVALRTAEAILNDEDTLAWLHRDDAPAPRGWGMTRTEVRRKWLEDARNRYGQALTEALAKHRGRMSVEAVKHFPALKSEAQYARSVLGRWAFMDELARHGVWNPDKDEVQKRKAELGRTYDLATTELVRRRDLAERGLLDRFTDELRQEG
jgi:hypothetical protein